MSASLAKLDRETINFSSLPKSGNIDPFFSSSSTLNIITGNVNNDRRVELSNGLFYETHEKFKFIHRINDILKSVTKFNSQIIGLCELDSVGKELIQSKLEQLGYTVITGAYAPGDQYTFYHLIAFDSKLIQSIESKMYWFTSTPTDALDGTKRPKFSLNFDNTNRDPLLIELHEEFEKGTLILVFNYASEKIIFSMNHFGLRKPYRLKSAELLNSFLNKLSAEYDTNKIIIGGDFNTFESDGGISQLDALTKDNYILASETSTFYDGTNDLGKATYTFLSYCYDVGLLRKDQRQWLDISKELDQITDLTQKRIRLGEIILEIHGSPLKSYLDHIMYKGFKFGKMRVLVPEKFDPHNVNDLFIESYQKAIPLTSSDHLFILSEFN